MEVRRYRVWLDRALSLVTVIVGFVAVYLLATERMIPALRGEPVPVNVGERLPRPLEFEMLLESRDRGGRKRITVPGEGAALLLVFNSTCPACYATLPAWTRVVGAAEGVASVLAVSLERDQAAARAYVRRHLPSTLAVEPADAQEVAGWLGIGIVPSTVLVGRDGVVKYVRQGSLDAAAVEALVSALEVLKGSSS